MAFAYELSDPSFVFHSAHFIAMRDGRESMHGHSYRVELSLRSSAPLDQSQLQKAAATLAQACRHLHCKFLLPEDGEFLSSRERDAEHLDILVWGKVTYTFPKACCVALPIPYSSAEMLSSYLSECLRSSVALSKVLMTLKVFEKEHQQAACLSKL